MDARNDENLIPRGGLAWKKALVGVIVSGLVLGAVFKVTSNEKILATMRSTPAGAWFACVPTFLFLHVLSALKWRFYMATCGARLGVRDSLRCHGAGLFANLCLPSLVGGDVLRAGLAMPRAENSQSVLLGSLLDRLSDVLGLALVSLVGLTFSPSAFAYLRTLEWWGLLLFFGAAAGGFGALVAAFLIFRKRGLRGRSRKVKRLAVRMRRALHALGRRKHRAIVGVAISAALQSLFVIVNWRLGAAMGFEMPLGLWLLLWPLAKIVAMAPFSFGGIGVREAAFAILVAPFADKTAAVAESLVWQSVLVVGGILCGIAFWVTRRPLPTR